MAINSHKYTVAEATNLQLGQCRSVYLDTTNAFTPKSGEAVIRIDIIIDAKFTLLTSESADMCVGTDGTDSAYAGITPGDRITSSTLFLAGLNLNGRWSAVTLAQGSVILYLQG